MSKKILFVVNPISGGRDKTTAIKRIKTWAQSSGHNSEIIETTGNDDEKKIKEALQTYKPQKLVAVGGDGTVLLCAGLVKDTDVALGIVPSGSANGMSVELELPPHIDDALKIIEKGKTKTIDMLLFNEEHLAMHISDVGLNANLVKHFEATEHRGFLGYAKGVIAELMNKKPFEAQLTLDGKPVEMQGYMIAFANASRYGTGALLNKIGKTDDGLFEVCVLTEVNLAGIAGQFFDFVDSDSSHLEVLQAKELELKVNRKVSFQIDGELQKDTDHLKVSICSKCLSVIIP